MASFETKRARVTYEQAPESPIHRIREEFRLSMPDPATASSGLEVADAMLTLIATVDREDAHRVIKLMRDLLDTLEPKVEPPK
jgi:hypothetical protein